MVKLVKHIPVLINKYHSRPKNHSRKYKRRKKQNPTHRLIVIDSCTARNNENYRNTNVQINYRTKIIFC